MIEFPILRADRRQGPMLSHPIAQSLAGLGLAALCAGGAVAQDWKPKVLMTDQFDKSTVIDNPWLPMKPGMRYIYEGTTVEEDGKVVPHKVVISITDLTKTIGGVRGLISYDEDYSDGELQEAELAIFAQDKQGNVWRLGEYPEEYDDGTKIEKAPAWIHGYDGALAGISMLADPKAGTPSYAQGWGPAVDWTDRGQVHLTGQKVKLAVCEYKDVLVIRETAQSEAGAYQLKYFARGVGNIKVGWTGKDKTKEVLELVRIENLDKAAMEKLRKTALKLEKSAYETTQTVYRYTEPAKLLGSHDEPPEHEHAPRNAPCGTE
jgi:hypothetical protein